MEPFSDLLNCDFLLKLVLRRNKEQMEAHGDKTCVKYMEQILYSFLFGILTII